MRRAGFGLIAVLALAACTNTGGVQGAPEPSGTRPALDVLKDSLIVAAIKAKLTGDDPDSATTLRVASRDGVVTLAETVRDDAARRRDVAGARAVAGVKNVVDALRVDPRGPRPGRQIADAALAARIIAGYTAAVGPQQHVTVSVDRGVATLGGTVADVPTRDRIVTTARATAGVRNVVDRMRVERQ